MSEYRRLFHRATQKDIFAGEFRDVDDFFEQAIKLGLDIEGSDEFKEPMPGQSKLEIRPPQPAKPAEAHESRKGRCLGLKDFLALSKRGRGALAVWCALCEQSRKRKRKGFSVSRSQLQKRCGGSPRYITNALAVLEKAGWLSREYKSLWDAGKLSTILHVHLLNHKLTPWRRKP